jgi:excisionase family DNA binding protein
MSSSSLNDVEIATPSYWLTHVEELQRLLTAPGTATIRSPGQASNDEEQSLLVVDPSYWATNVDALIEVLVDPLDTGFLIPEVHVPGFQRTELIDERDAEGEQVEPSSVTKEFPYEAARRADTATSAPFPERLTLTVEEAAATLGISRAFAYEAVRRGEIPSIRIGRRVLVPHAALNRLLSATDPPSAAE